MLKILVSTLDWEVSVSCYHGSHLDTATDTSGSSKKAQQSQVTVILSYALKQRALASCCWRKPLARDPRCQHTIADAKL
jgi:hypothetical protein